MAYGYCEWLAHQQERAYEMACSQIRTEPDYEEYHEDEEDEEDV